jgi:hypothetical protein
MNQFLLQTAFWTLLCIGTEALLGVVLHWGFPYNYPMVHHREMFLDFNIYVSKFHHFHSRAFYVDPPLTYPAPASAVYELFFLGPARHRGLPAHLYLFAILLCSAIALLLFYKALLRRQVGVGPAAIFVAVLYLCSFPLWFDFHQANIEFAVWVVLSCGIWAHWRGHSWIAAACFGLGAAMKLFPVIFLCLLLSRRQYRQLAFAMVVAAVATVAGLWLLCPDLAYSWQQTNAAIATLHNSTMLVIWPIQSGFDHTLFCLFKRSLPTLPPPAELNRFLNRYLATAALGGVALYFLRIRKLPLVNQVLCLTIASILLPPVSYDYTLLHLYAPFVLLTFVVLSRPMEYNKPPLAAFSLFAFLLAPQSEFILHGLRFAGQLKAVALAALLLIGLLIPFEVAPEPVSAIGCSPQLA